MWAENNTKPNAVVTVVGRVVVTRRTTHVVVVVVERTTAQHTPHCYKFIPVTTRPLAKSLLGIKAFKIKPVRFCPVFQVAFIQPPNNFPTSTSILAICSY
jgi:hypothetical protein